MSRKKILKMIVMLLAPFCFATMMQLPTHAAANFNTIRAKAALEGVYQCFTNASLRNSAGSPYNGSWTYDGRWVISGKGNNKFYRQSGANDAVKLPYGLTDATDNNTDCGQILFGFNTNLSANDLKTAQDYGANISDDQLKEGLVPSSIQGSLSVNEIKNYFAGTSGNGGSGSMNYKATAEDTATAGESYSQITYKFEANEYSQCLTDSGMPASSSAMTRTDENGNSTTVPGIIFPAVAKADSGTVAVEGVGYNVPTPGSADSYVYSICGVSFRVNSIPDNKEYEYQIIPMNTMLFYGVSTKKGVWDSYTDPVADVHTSNNGNQNSVWLVPSVSTGTVSSSSAASSAQKYTFNWDSNGNTMYAIKKLNDTNTIGYKVPGLTNSYSSLALTSQEVFDLYKYYLRGVYGVPVACEGEENYEGISKDSSSKMVKWVSGKTCYAYTGYSGVKSPRNKVYGVQVGTQRLGGVDVPTILDWHFKYEISLNDVIDTLNVLPIATLDNSESGGTADNIASGGSGAVVNPTDGDNQTEATCGNTGAAASLGWIVCPIMQWLSGTAAKVYDTFLEPALQVDPILFNEQAGDNNDTRDAWNIFRNMANLVFIILLMVVIFSQLTGVGIDNYGIKRILPKLIVAAVLVNLSYFICVACVDLSNIIGNGVQSLFETLGSSMTVSVTSLEGVQGSTAANAEVSSAGLSEIGATALSAVGIGVGLFLVGRMVWQNPAVLLTLLVSLLGVVVAVLFLFLILAAREAAIVVLVVISPLAFVGYMLPNTKKLFDRWLKMGEGLLLVYPICGLLVAGGNYVSKLLLVAGNGNLSFFSAFAALAVGIVPIFFIPTVLRSSFSAMGNLGAKISGFGQRLGTGAMRGIRNTERYKNAQKVGLERRTRKIAGLDTQGRPTEAGLRKIRRSQSGIGKFFGTDRQRAAYIAAAQKNQKASEEATATLMNTEAKARIPDAPDMSGAGLINDSNFGKGTREAYYADQFVKAAQAGDTNGMNAAIAAAAAAGVKDKYIAKMLRSANNNGLLNLDSTTKSSWLQGLSTQYGNGFLATDFELKDWAQKGGNAALGDFGQYASTNAVQVEDVKPEDVLKLSGASLAGMISSGKLDQAMAQRVMQMNPNISSDKRVMLGAAANGMIAKGVDVKNLKDEAEKLARNHNLASGGSSLMYKVDQATGQRTEITPQMIQAWTEATPQAANIVQNFSGGGEQFIPVDVNLRDSGPAPAPQPQPVPQPTPTLGSQPGQQSGSQPTIEVVGGGGLQSIDELRRRASQTPNNPPVNPPRNGGGA